MSDLAAGHRQPEENGPGPRKPAWHQFCSQAPAGQVDLRAYVETSGNLNPTELVEMLCTDQVERWNQGERIPAETYLQLHPCLQGESPLAFELIYGEFVLREHLGESPSLSEYRWRFPFFAERLQRQMGLHQALGVNADLQESLKPSGTILSPSPGEHLGGGTSENNKAISGYEILDELGRGGMSVVYRARQLSLNRVVAIKVIRDRLIASAQEVQRFRAEAEVVARLQHPHIVQIYEVGEADKLLYLALELVEGGNLQKKLAGVPQESTVAAQLVETLARSIHYAHQRGIIHRDLSPANILLQPLKPQENGKSVGDSLALYQPKISDFGLAKQLSGAEGHTRTGDVVGTPAYMAPEQAQGRLKEISAATDVYALGAVLYEMLTGRPPFKGASAVDTMLQLCTLDPVSPRQLQPRVPADLETICLKCLEKEPRRRYASAEALADDLQRYRAGEPILARPTPVRERMWKWARRRPIVAGLIAAIVVVTTLGFGLVFWQWSIAREQWGFAEARAGAEREARNDAQEKEKREREARNALATLSARVMLDQGALVCSQGELDRGLLLLARGLDLAVQAQDNDLQRVARLNLAMWRQQLIRLRSSFTHKNIVMDAVFSPDGRTVLTGSHDMTAMLWEADTAKPVGEPLRHDVPVNCVAFCPDGKSVLTGGGWLDPKTPGAARLWDAKTGRPLGPPLTHEDNVGIVAFSPKGDLFLTVTVHQAQVWETATQKPRGGALEHEGASLKAATFSPDGSKVLTGGSDSRARLWDALTGRPINKPVSCSARVMCVAFNPDGNTFVTGAADGSARLWQTKSGLPYGLPMNHLGLLMTVAFSPDGKFLATGSVLVEEDAATKRRHASGGLAYVWHADGKPTGSRPMHPSAVWSVAISADNRLLLTGCEDGAARLFRIASGEMIGRPLIHEGTVRTVAFGPRDRSVLTASAGGDMKASARLWAFPAGLERCTTLPIDAAIRTLHFSPDGKTLLAGQLQGSVELLDMDSHKVVALPSKTSQYLHAAVFSPDGRTVLTVREEACLWDRASGRLLQTLEHGRDMRVAAFSPDGRAVLLGNQDGIAQLWDPNTGHKVGPPLVHPRPLVGVAFGADGATVVTAATDDVVREWDRETGKLSRSSPTPATLGFAIFSPTGLMGMVYGEGRFAQLRTLGPSPVQGPLLANSGAQPKLLNLSQDGLFALGTGPGRSVRIWDTVTGQSIGQPVPNRNNVFCAAIDPTGRRLAVGGDQPVQLWELPAPTQGTAEQIRLWVELATGLELDAQGSTHELSLADQETRRQSLVRLSGPESELLKAD